MNIPPCTAGKHQLSDDAGAHHTVDMGRHPANNIYMVLVFVTLMFKLAISNSDVHVKLATMASATTC